MLQVKNSTPFVAQLMAIPDQNGIDTVFTVVKGTFSIGQTFGLADEQVPIVLADEHHDDPLSTSIRSPSDVSLMKLGTDVLLMGSAWAPNEKPTWQIDVSMAVGPVEKTLRVFGERVWDAGGAMSWVAPFVRMPLVWERAFGGGDQTSKGVETEARNPVGVGFRASNSDTAVVGRPLPNVEDPQAPFSAAKERPAPAGFAPVAPHWLPRRSYAGTYDDAWQRDRAPYLPADFDPRYCQIAPPGLSTPRPMQGGELVDLRGLTRGGALRFLLPAVRLLATYRIESQLEVRPATLDTVLIEPDANRLVMVWRAALQCDKKVLKVREVDVSVVDFESATAA